MARTKKEVTEVSADKNEAFNRVAQKRVQKALTAIRLIGNLGGASYAHTPKQAENVRAHLEAAVESALARLEGESEDAGELEI